MVDSNTALREGDAIIAVDVQNDFCPEGSLPIKNGNDVIPILNEWFTSATRTRVLIYASRDWHPANHPSFVSEGGHWPPHCLQDSDGASFHPDLNLPDDAIIVTKGTRFDKDQYSAFDETGLAVELIKRRVHRVWVGGLALDVCVRATALDACEQGLEVHLIKAATKPVTPEGGSKAIVEMQRAGIVIED